MAAKPVWANAGGSSPARDAIVRYCAGRDALATPAADEQIARYDILTNLAHSRMLCECGILPAPQHDAIRAALLAVLLEKEAGGAILDPACEDIHMSIEAGVSATAGEEAGGRLHTARSRNDQVATDMRLWLRDRIADDIACIASLATTIADHARRHVETVCPGLTHTQPAMITTWGHWVAAYLPRLLRDARALAGILPDLRTCPLGAAASFGTGWPIDRERTARLLGFRYPTPSSADGVWARGEMEAHYAFHAAQFLGHLSSIGEDLILLSSPPRNWLRLHDDATTGSSIMPQKRNPDFAEVTRARAATAAGNAAALLGIARALPSGYNRDTQWTKSLALAVASECEGAAAAFAFVFESLLVRADAMEEACGRDFLNAADVADFIASSRNLPFRECYKAVARAVAACEREGRLSREAVDAAMPGAALTESEWSDLDSPRALLARRRQPGSPNPVETLKTIELVLGEIDEIAARVATDAKAWRAALASLAG